MQNIVLSGGSTIFQYFAQRLKRDLKQLVDRRLEASVIASGNTQKVGEQIRLLALHLSYVTVIRC